MTQASKQAKWKPNENPPKEFLTIKSYESQCDNSDKALNIETLFFL